MAKTTSNRVPRYQEESERVARERRLRPIIRNATRISVIAMLCVLVGVTVWLVRAGHMEYLKNEVVALWLLGSSKIGFNLERVFIEGLDNLDEETVLATLPEQVMGVEEKAPILGIDLPELKQKLEGIGWIKEVDIERQLPSTLHIRVIERQPRALWQHLGTVGLIDATGVEITRKGLTRYRNLPVLVGEEVPNHVAELFEVLMEEPEIAELMVSAQLVGGRRWDITLQNDIEIKLPEENASAAWRKLADLHRTKQLLDRTVKVIDLRVEDRLFLKPG